MPLVKFLASLSDDLLVDHAHVRSLRAMAKTGAFDFKLIQVLVSSLTRKGVPMNDFLALFEKRFGTRLRNDSAEYIAQARGTSVHYPDAHGPPYVGRQHPSASSSLSPNLRTATMLRRLVESAGPDGIRLSFLRQMFSGKYHEELEVPLGDKVKTIVLRTPGVHIQTVGKQLSAVARKYHARSSHLP